MVLDKFVMSVLYHVLLVLFKCLVRWQVGADIVKRALAYPLKLIAKNAGVNGSVVSEKVYMITVQLFVLSLCRSLSWLYEIVEVFVSLSGVVQ